MKKIFSWKKSAGRRFWHSILILAFLAAGPAWGAEGGKFSFPAMTGWKQSSEVLVYSPEKLFDYINGGADLYLKYDFQELRVAEYQGENEASIMVEVYRHKTPTDAFGIYSQERLSNANYLPIGAQGYQEEGVFNFVAAQYYVKISSANMEGKDEKVLQELARKIAGNLGASGGLPVLLSAFPEEGKRKNSERYIAQNFLGYGFLRGGYTADYDLAGKKWKLFIIAAQVPGDCRSMLAQYWKKIGQEKTDLGEGPYTIPDPYHGKIDLTWKGKYIWGTLGLDDSKLGTDYLNRLEKRLPK
jgi:hypothetical protein